MIKRSMLTKWYCFQLSLLVTTVLTASTCGQSAGSDVSFERTVQFTSNQKVNIPPPRILPSLSLDQRLETAKQLSSKIGWDQWSRDSLNASVVIEIDSITNDASEQVGHRVFSAYTVHATLEQLQSSNLLEQVNAIDTSDSSPSSTEQSSPEASSNEDTSKDKAANELTQEQLKEAGIDSTTSSNVKYAQVRLPLLNKVEISGVMRTEKRVTDQSILLLWNIVEDIPQSHEFAANWRKSERDELGELVTSEPQPYSGLGGYIHITMLDPVTSLAVVESTMVIQEPQEWFSGSRFLRSKLLILLQESARDFRRALEKLKAKH